ncbi:hypothetical protein A2U01_0021739, partial [Trifolium medium]|nr:hypothetical protein [Trifolium medium]
MLDDRKKETHFGAMCDTVEHQTDRTICSIGKMEFVLTMPAAGSSVTGNLALT